MTKTKKRETRAKRDGLKLDPEAGPSVDPELARKLIYDSLTWDSEQAPERTKGKKPTPSLPEKDEAQLVELIERLALMKDKLGDWLPIFDNGDDFGIWDKLHEELDQAGFVVSPPDDGGSYTIECGNAVVTLHSTKFQATVFAIRAAGDSVR